MKLFLLKLPILIGFVIAACSTDNPVELSSDSSSAFQAIQEAPPTEQAAPDADFTERKIIREGDLYFECRDITETDAFLKNETKNLKGFISNESSNSYEERTEKRLTIRVPTDQLDPLIQKIQDHAVKIENINIRSEDVTEQFIDVEARLKTKKELEIRYTELLKVARTVDEILGLERELANVRGEIESMQGRLDYLSDRVSLSTLNVFVLRRRGKGLRIYLKTQRWHQKRLDKPAMVPSFSGESLAILPHLPSDSFPYSEKKEETTSSYEVRES